MKYQAFNPFLPSWEYIPDGEPHIFGNRVYLYGSHDKFNGNSFCKNDYVCWSAPVDDLSDWKYEGVIWSKKQDPRKKGNMYAPDVCRSPDGKFYLYYAFAPGITRKSWSIRVAVADSPVGPFRYHGEVDLYPWIKEYLPFDPAVYVEDGRVWLYYGSGMFFPVLGISKRNIKGGAVIELDPRDMKTPIRSPKLTVTSNKSSKLAEHAFFEASSVRKIKDKYYFIYSSRLGHELCYATSDKPDGDWKYGGTIVSNGDIGLENHKNVLSASNHMGNIHGSLLEVNNTCFIFYHRHTNRACFSRQACAEEIQIEKDGSIQQVEMTSCGLNGKPLEGRGTYEARIACNLYSRNGVHFYRNIIKKKKGIYPYFTQTGTDRESDPDQYIANFCNGTTAGFKYFDLKGIDRISVTVKGNARGRFVVRIKEDDKPVCIIPVFATECLENFCGEWKGGNIVAALYFTYEGKGKCDFYAFTFG